MRAFVYGLLIVITVFALATPVAAVANTFACCIPDGTCEDLTEPSCTDLNGISVFATTCADSPCNVMVPVISLPALFALVTALLTVAIYGLMRRVRRQ